MSKVFLKRCNNNCKAMRTLRINLSHIITFLYVAELKSYKDAAEQLFITQPAVSMQIKAFEKQYGIKLFRSKNRALTLTKVGEQILPLARTLYETAFTCEDYLDDVRKLEKGELHLGVARTLNLFIANYVFIFRKKFPGVRVVIHEDSSKKILEGLKNFVYDLAVVAHCEDDPKIYTECILEEEMVFVVSPLHPLAKKNRVSITELDGEKFILQGEGSGTRANILTIFKENSITPNIVTEVDNLQTIKRFIMQNRGISLMYPPLIEKELGEGSIAKIPIDRKISITIESAFLDKTLTSPLVTTFLEILKMSTEIES